MPVSTPSLDTCSESDLTADIADSTALTERLGDAAFRTKARERNDRRPADGADPPTGRRLRDPLGQAVAAAGITPNCRMMCAMSMFSRSSRSSPRVV